MIAWLSPSPSLRGLLPGGKLRGPTPWVIALMTFVMMIISAAALALANAAGGVTGQAEGRFVAQIRQGQEGLGPAVRQLQAVPGIGNVEPVPEAEMRRILERWLGPAASSADLPVPALIHFDIAAGVDPTVVERTVAKVSPGARVSGHSGAIAPLLGTMRALQWLCFALVLMMLAATSAAVVLAARGALDTNRPTIDIMHGIGATDLQVTHLFQRKIALDAALGAVLGAAAAAITLLLLVGGNAVMAAELGGLSPLEGRDLLLLAVLPLLLAILATWVARLAVLTTLRRAT
jgi:cell division transport system permease protein